MDERLKTFSLIQDGENCWVYQLPDRLVKMLADLTVSTAGDAASIWAHREELRPRHGGPADSSPLKELVNSLKG